MLQQLKFEAGFASLYRLFTLNDTTQNTTTMTIKIDYITKQVH